MTTMPAPALEAAATRDLVDLVPLISRERNWTAWIGPILSIALLAAVFLQIGVFDFSVIFSLVPRTPLFWAVFAITYSVTPLFDWLIFNRLWAIPRGGVAALFHKRLSNELLLGYVGDLYFYAWARRNVAMPGSPFGAVKDSALLSGMMGNLVTLAMLALTFPLLNALHLSIDTRALILSLATLVLCSVLPMMFRQRLFSLPAAEQRAIAGLHLARIVVNLLLYATLWHLMLPDVALSMWVMLSTVRLALSRLPLVPNKDVLFAGVATLVVGSDGQVAEVLALMASLLLGAHLLIGLLLGTSDLLRRRRRQ